MNPLLSRKVQAKIERSSVAGVSLRQLVATAVELGSPQRDLQAVLVELLQGGFVERSGDTFRMSRSVPGRRILELEDEPPAEDQKHCSGCDRVLPATNTHFSNSAHHADGLKPICKKCSNARRRAARRSVACRQGAIERFVESADRLTALTERVGARFGVGADQ